LQLLANAKSKEDLLALLTKRGPQAVCFCHPAADPTCQLPRKESSSRRRRIRRWRICLSVSFRCLPVRRLCARSIRRQVVR
jgi:hypothetical protein